MKRSRRGKDPQVRAFHRDFCARRGEDHASAPLLLLLHSLPRDGEQEPEQEQEPERDGVAANGCVRRPAPRGEPSRSGDRDERRET